MVLISSHPASERFYEHEKYSECLQCHEAVYNPICPVCISFHIEAWLSSYPYFIRKKLMKTIKEYVQKTKSISDKRGKATKCIICKKQRAFLCPYCFTEYVLDLLKKLKISKIILQEFLQFFNYDFEHTGYYKEAEKLGVV